MFNVVYNDSNLKDKNIDLQFLNHPNVPTNVELGTLVNDLYFKKDIIKSESKNVIN